ncbi:Fur family transcriptional regulator [Nocardioides pacificus]
MHHHPIASPETVLREAGLRVTKPRLAVISALAATPHSGADAVLTAVRREAEVSTQAVYDVLNTLTEKGVLRKFHPAGSVARYELRTDDNHHHLVCRSCGAVTDVDCATGAAPCLDPEPLGSRGFIVDEAEVTFWGLCSSCQTAARSGS